MEEPVSINSQTVDMTEVVKDIADVLNRHSVDNMIGLPDFVLATFMVKTLVPLSDITSAIEDSLYSGGFDD